MTSQFRKIALILGLLSAIGPFAIDMYLPALPAIGQGLGANVGQVQWSLTAFFIGLALGQPFYGPLSDMLGRKRPLYAGLALFVLASIGCALANDITALVAMRFAQGLGAAATMAIPRAIVRDLHTGTDAARLMSLLMLVLSVSPILAPLTGSVVIAMAGWRMVFWGVALVALAGLVMTGMTLQETRPADKRVESSVRGALRAYARLLRDRRYLGLVLIGSFALGGFFVYLANSPFVMIQHYGLTPTQYGLAFSLNAVAFIGASQFTGRLGDRFGMEAVVKIAAVGAAAVTLALLACYLLGADNLVLLIAMYFIASVFLGLIVPTTAVLALDDHGANAGTASALLGTLQMLVGGLMMGVIGLCIDGKPLTMVAGMASGPVIALALTWLTLGGSARRTCAAT